MSSELPTLDRGALEAALAYTFQAGAVVTEALTHSSFAHETGGGVLHNERLEFLGDAVLGLSVGHWLYAEHRERPEGELTQMRAQLVRAEGLASVAREIGLGPMLLMGVGEERTGGRDRESVLADAMEAVLGAVYLDGGYAAAEAVVRHLYGSRMQAMHEGPPRDPKSLLQEWAQAKHRVTPAYRVVGSSGPPHDSLFEAEVTIGHVIRARGTGRSKQGAQKAAAREALRRAGVSGGASG